MKKLFKLPKEFTTVWLEALRSGEYKQGVARLAVNVDSDLCGDDTPEIISKTQFCCLGVACNLVGYSVSSLVGSYYISNSFKKMPEQFRGVPSSNEFVSVVSRLNDGFTTNFFNQVCQMGCIFRDEVVAKIDTVVKYRFDFKEISDFIEDNCELIDEPKPIENV